MAMDCLENQHLRYYILLKLKHRLLMQVEKAQLLQPPKDYLFSPVKQTGGNQLNFTEMFIQNHL